MQHARPFFSSGPYNSPTGRLSAAAPIELCILSPSDRQHEPLKNAFDMNAAQTILGLQTEEGKRERERERERERVVPV
jgi:hypothetical protein